MPEGIGTRAKCWLDGWCRGRLGGVLLHLAPALFLQSDALLSVGALDDGFQGHGGGVYDRRLLGLPPRSPLQRLCTAGMHAHHPTCQRSDFSRKDGRHPCSRQSAQHAASPTYQAWPYPWLVLHIEHLFCRVQTKGSGMPEVKMPGRCTLKICTVCHARITFMSRAWLCMGRYKCKLKARAASSSLCLGTVLMCFHFGVPPLLVLLSSGSWQLRRRPAELASTQP